MLSKIKNFVDTEDKKRLLSNFFSLAFLQGANYILPLITFPYLVRVIGIEYFGLLAFASATIAYFNILIDYGFNLTATREISTHRNNKEKVIEVFSSVMTIKLILMFIALILLSILIFCFEKFSEYWYIYYLTFGTVIGQFLFPVWLFQGMEKMKFITYLNITSKLFSTIAIFVFIHQREDFYLVPIFTSIGFIVAGIASWIIANKEFSICYKLQTTNKLIFYVKKGWHIFVASLSGNLYGQGNTIILGLFTTPAIVSYYSVGAKMASAITSLFLVVSQTIFPYLVKLKNENFDTFKYFIKKLFMYVSLANITLIGALICISDDVYTLITGMQNEIGFYSFSFWLVIAFLTIYNVVLNPIIVSLKQDKFMSKMYLFIGISFVVFGSFLTYKFGYKGMLFAMLTVEVFIFIFSIISIKLAITRKY